MESAVLYANGNHASSDSNSDSELMNGKDSTKLHEVQKAQVNGDINGRVKRKAKRLTQFAKQNGTAPVPVNGSVNGHAISANRQIKNQRRSRSGYGRGLPKKGGAGGKGTWGRPGSELIDDEDVVVATDSHDPNYDSDSQENIALEQIVPDPTDEMVQKLVQPILLEYLEHGDSTEVALSLDELSLGSKRYQVLVLAVNLAMDHKPSHREMTSVLISDLYGRSLSQQDIARGFDALLKALPDTVLDTPEAPVLLGNFLARAVADDCVPPKLVSSYKGKVECVHACVALDRADVLLNMKHGLVRLDNVWGVGGGTRPVKYLIKKMVLLLQEYLSSGDVTEATRCLLELEVPHFHHELVLEAVVMVLEDTGTRVAELICKFLKSLYSAIIVTPDQMTRGFDRVYDEMPEICIDVPAAYALLENFVERCKLNGIVTDETVKKMPVRGRKRFVSEGDGGRIKE